MDSNMDIYWWSTIDFVIIWEGYIQRNIHIFVYYAVGQRWNGTMFIIAIPPVGNAPAGTRCMKYTCVSCACVISFRWSPLAIADIKPDTFYGLGGKQRWIILHCPQHSERCMNQSPCKGTKTLFWQQERKQIFITSYFSSFWAHVALLCGMCSRVIPS